MIERDARDARDIYIYICIGGTFLNGATLGRVCHVNNNVRDTPGNRKGPRKSAEGEEENVAEKKRREASVASSK